MINPPATQYTMFELFSLQPKEVGTDILPMNNINTLPEKESLIVVTPSSQKTIWKKYQLYIAVGTLLFIAGGAFVYYRNKKKASSIN